MFRGLGNCHRDGTCTQRTINHPPSCRAKYRSVMTLPPAPLLEQPAVVRCLEGLSVWYAQEVRPS
jgi:hypothetical protein